MLNEKTEERVKEAMEAHGFDVTIESNHIRFSTSKKYITAYQFAIMQMAGEVEHIIFPTNTIYVKRLEKSMDPSNSIKSNDESRDLFPYLPVKFNDISFEIRCLQCGSVFIHKLVEPSESSLCTNCKHVLKNINDQYESAPTPVSLDPEEVKEYEKGNRSNADDKVMSMYFGPALSINSIIIMRESHYDPY